MSMIAYSTIDVLDEKQKLHSGKEKDQDKQQNQKPFLGLMQECFVS